MNGDRALLPEALARGAVRICGDCGTDEAVRDARGLPPIPPGEWPNTGELLTWPGVPGTPAGD